MQYPRVFREAQECGEEVVAWMEKLVDKVTLCPIEKDQQAFLLRMIYRGDLRGFNTEWALVSAGWRRR